MILILLIEMCEAYVSQSWKGLLLAHRKVLMMKWHVYKKSSDSGHPQNSKRLLSSNLGPASPGQPSPATLGLEVAGLSPAIE